MTKRQLMALVQWNWKRHVDAKHDGTYSFDCDVCEKHYDRAVEIAREINGGAR